VLTADFLVVPGNRKRSNRASVNAFAAGTINKEKTPGAVMVIVPDRRLYFYFCHHRPDSHCFAFGRNQSVA
jgi:hypothetical protein